VFPLGSYFNTYGRFRRKLTYPGQSANVVFWSRATGIDVARHLGSRTL